MFHPSNLLQLDSCMRRLFLLAALVRLYAARRKEVIRLRADLLC
jgi:hypothetical protein